MNRQIALTAFIAAIVLGTASTVWAGPDRDGGSRGYQVQTWQDIARASTDIDRQVQALEHKTSAGSSYGYVASQQHKHAAH
jgi:hypothetical protein